MAGRSSIKRGTAALCKREDLVGRGLVGVHSRTYIGKVARQLHDGVELDNDLMIYYSGLASYDIAEENSQRGRG